MDDIVKFNIGEYIVILKKLKIRLLSIIIVMFIIGAVISTFLREEFTATGKILPEVQGKGGLSQFAGLASLAGVDFGGLNSNGIDAVRPDIYPDVVSSTPFFLALLKYEVSTVGGKKNKFADYYHMSIEGQSEITDDDLKKVNKGGDNLIVLNKLEFSRIQDLRKRMGVELDRKSGIITITVKMPDPVVAAEVAEFTMSYLIQYVKKYRTEKLQHDVTYLESQVVSSRGKYYRSQERKARYTDEFQDIRLQSADVARERLDAEYRLSSNFYGELLKKYEEAKFKLHQETPVFKVLEPPVVPVKKSEPKRVLICAFFFFIGIFIAIAYSLITDHNYKRIIG